MERINSGPIEVTKIFFIPTLCYYLKMGKHLKSMFKSVILTMEKVKKWKYCFLTRNIYLSSYLIHKENRLCYQTRDVVIQKNKKCIGYMVILEMRSVTEHCLLIILILTNFQRMVSQIENIESFPQPLPINFYNKVSIGTGIVFATLQKGNSKNYSYFSYLTYLLTYLT